MGHGASTKGVLGMAGRLIKSKYRPSILWDPGVANLPAYLTIQDYKRTIMGLCRSGVLVHYMLPGPLKRRGSELRVYLKST